MERLICPTFLIIRDHMVLFFFLERPICPMQNLRGTSLEVLSLFFYLIFLGTEFILVLSIVMCWSPVVLLYLSLHVTLASCLRFNAMSIYMKLVISLMVLNLELSELDNLRTNYFVVWFLFVTYIPNIILDDSSIALIFFCSPGAYLVVGT